MRVLRDAAGLSQRRLAERLAAEGLTLDASAITRIEQGKRDLKLAEAVAIAKVLGMSVAQMAGVEELPDNQTLERLRHHANQRMGEARRALVDMLDTFYEIQVLLRQSPDLLPTLADTHDPAPEDVEAYLPWVRRRIQRLASDWVTAYAETREDAESLRKIATSLVGHAVFAEEGYRRAPLDGQHPEA